MDEKEKEFDLRNYEHYKYYYQDTSKEEILQDTWIDYCAYKNIIEKNIELEKQLDIANNKLKEVKELTDKEKEVFIHDYSCITPSNLEAKLWNNHGTEFMDEVLSIIGENDE